MLPKMTGPIGNFQFLKPCIMVHLTYFMVNLKLATRVMILMFEILLYLGKGCLNPSLLLETYISSSTWDIFN